MEPLSFTASLITVIGVVTASSGMIYNLREKLTNAPKDVENLLEQLRTFEGLLKELEAQLRDYRNSVPPQDTLQQVWGGSVAQMQRDIECLHNALARVEPLLKRRTLGSRVVLLARRILSEKEVAGYRVKIDIHCGILSNIQAMVCG